MSQWIDIKKENLALDDNGKEINVWFESDDSGNRYVILKIDDIKDLLNVGEFMECDSCKIKPGSPTLCNGCLNNRMVINNLKK
jgi:hypothetical protein